MSADALLVVEAAGVSHAVDRQTLRALPQVDVAARVPGREGTAVEVGALLDALGVTGETMRLVSSDGTFDAEVPLAAVRHALLLHALEGGPLPERFGGPMRFLVPDAADCGAAAVDACANVKHVGRIRLS